MKAKTQWVWHVHHGVLLEPLVLPIEERQKYIREQKAPDESKEQIELRLRLLKPVQGVLPTKVVGAWEFYNEKWWVNQNNHKGIDNTQNWEVYLKVLSDHKAEIDALHALECLGCPWDGETIFTEEKYKAQS